MKKEEEFYDQWRKKEGITIDGYSLNRQQMFALLKDYATSREAELKKVESVCACTISDTPCKPHCSCKNPVMSGGCYNCATYGNEEQKKAAAEGIQQRVSELISLRQALSERDKEVEELRLGWGVDKVSLKLYFETTKRLKELVEKAQYIGQAGLLESPSGTLRKKITDLLSEIDETLNPKTT